MVVPVSIVTWGDHLRVIQAETGAMSPNAAALGTIHQPVSSTPRPIP